MDGTCLITWGSAVPSMLKDRCPSQYLKLGVGKIVTIAEILYEAELKVTAASFAYVGYIRSRCNWKKLNMEVKLMSCESFLV